MTHLELSATIFTRGSHPLLAARLFRFRHQLFVQELGWSLETRNSLECDEFDTEHAVYCALLAERRMIGCFRAISCDRPYLAQQKFPHMASLRPYPTLPDHLEISRLGVLSGYRAASASLYSLMVRVALARKATALVALAELSHERHLNRIGLRTQRYGDRQIVGFRDDGGWILGVAGEIRLPVTPPPPLTTLLNLTRTMDIDDEAHLLGRERFPA